MIMPNQMYLSLRFHCEHRNGFVTHAYVPAGLACMCGALLAQYIPLPPKVLGYISADWQWKLDGKAWTTKEGA